MKALDHNSKYYYDLYVEKMRVNNIKFIRVNKESFTFSGTKLVGVFSSIEFKNYVGLLKIATGGEYDDWFTTFIHETSHLDQFLEFSPYWNNVFIGGIHNSNSLIDKYLIGEPYNKSLLRKAVKAVTALEWDCERRAIEKIKEYAIPIDVENYILNANAYLFSHSMLLYLDSHKNGTWPTPSDELFDKLPTNFLPLESYYKIPRVLKKYYK